MKLLERDKKDIYFAHYLGHEEIVKDGVFTGAQKKLYGAVQHARMPVGTPRGKVALEFFGLQKDYRLSMWTEDMKCPITEETIVWLNQGKLNVWSESTRYGVGDKVIYGYQILECTTATKGEFSAECWKNVPHTHIIVSVSRTPNTISFGLQSVSVSS